MMWLTVFMLCHDMLNTPAPVESTGCKNRVLYSLLNLRRGHPTHNICTLYSVMRILQ